MCNTSPLQNMPSSNMNFPQAKDLCPATGSLRVCVLSFNAPTATLIMDALEQLLGDGFVSFTDGGYYADLTAEQVTEFSEQSDVLILGDHLLVWKAHALFADVRCPVMMMDPSMVFHPYQSSARHVLRQRGLDVLPAEDPQRIVASFTALRAKAWLKNSTAIVISVHDNPHPMCGDVEARAKVLQEMTGVHVVAIPAARLQALAKQVPLTAAQQVWEHWHETLISDVDPALSQDHLLDVARLYVAMHQLIDEHLANAITVQEFEPFLFQKKAMPNVAYAALRAQGITTSEEGDVAVLISQLLLASVSQQQAMMANIYLGFRDAWEVDKKPVPTDKAIAADYHQSLAEDTVMLCHFATAGTVPRCMTDDAKYRVVQTLPCWEGQSMTFALPKLGDAVLCRLEEASSQLHVYPGQVTKTYDDSQGGWYRGRWLMKLDDIQHFVDHAFSAHYAIGMNYQQQAIKTLCDLLKVELCTHQG